MLSDLEAAVAKLSEHITAQDLADFLIDVGVKGVRDEGTCCPVARWLRQELQVPYARVDIEDITIADEIGNEYTVSTPAVVGRFTTLFDLHDEFDNLADLDGPTDEELATIAAELAVEEQDLRATQFV